MPPGQLRDPLGVSPEPSPGQPHPTLCSVGQNLGQPQAMTDTRTSDLRPHAASNREASRRRARRPTSQQALLVWPWTKPACLPSPRESAFSQHTGYAAAGRLSSKAVAKPCKTRPTVLPTAHQALFLCWPALTSQPQPVFPSTPATLAPVPWQGLSSLLRTPSFPSPPDSFLRKVPADWLPEVEGLLQARINPQTSTVAGHLWGRGLARPDLCPDRSDTTEGTRSQTGSHEDRYSTRIVRGSGRESCPEP